MTIVKYMLMLLSLAVFSDEALGDEIDKKELRAFLVYPLTLRSSTVNSWIEICRCKDGRDCNERILRVPLDSLKFAGSLVLENDSRGFVKLVHHVTEEQSLVVAKMEYLRNWYPRVELCASGSGCRYHIERDPKSKSLSLTVKMSGERND